MFFYIYFLDTATALGAAQHDVGGELIPKFSSSSPCALVRRERSETSMRQTERHQTSRRV